MPFLSLFSSCFVVVLFFLAAEACLLLHLFVRFGRLTFRGLGSRRAHFDFRAVPDTEIDVELFLSLKFSVGVAFS